MEEVAEVDTLAADEAAAAVVVAAAAAGGDTSFEEAWPATTAGRS